MRLPMIFALAVLTPISATSCQKREATSPGIPESWLGTKEAKPGSDGQIDEGTGREAGATVDQILDVHHGVLEGLSGASEAPMVFLGAGQDCPRPWHLGGYITDIAVTIQGVLGVLIGSGTASAEARWKPLGELGEHLKTESGQIHLNEFATSKQLEAQLEPSIQAALGSGLIRDERKLRAGLLDAARNFQAIAQTLGAIELRSKRWDADNFRVEVQFDANGNPLPILNVGAGVYFRFDWDKRKSNSVRGLASIGGDRLSQRVQGFVAAIANDLGVLETNADVIENKGYQLTEVRIGVGATAGGEFGVAQASAQTIGSFTFHPKDPGPQPLDWPGAAAAFAEEEGTLELIADSDLVRASKALGSAEQIDELRAQDSGKTLVRFRRSTFRNGLRRASGLASFYIHRAANARAGRWGLFEIHTEFDMSLSGALGIATVGGTGALELTYENKNI